MLDTPKNAPVNGIDIEALGKMVEAINDDSSKASARFQVTSLGGPDPDGIIRVGVYTGWRICCAPSHDRRR
jgi:hypothetical protein